jgi:hemoglobin
MNQRMLPENQVFDVLGEEGFQLICREFYRRVPDDEILGPMYPAEDMVGAEQRLADFLIYRFGGPQRYISQRGHPRLRARHMPFAIDIDARDRWMKLMTESIHAAAIAEDAANTLLFFFDKMATFLVNK